MNAVQQLLTDHLDIWLSADTEKKTGRGRSSNRDGQVYGIKKLRELILELAVRGLLVPQDPNDEPTSELLKRTQIERANLIKAGKIKNDKIDSNITNVEKPFESPKGWNWIRIANVGFDLGQKTPSGNFTYIDVGSINNRLGFIENPSVLGAENAPSRARKVVKKETVIYSTVRPYLLNIAVIQHDFFPEPIASTAFAVVHPFEGILSKYIYHYLRSPIFVSYVESVQTGIAYPAINDKQFFNGLIPIPPTLEQHRIVAKVDELMALCDKLEGEQLDADRAHQQLVEELLATLTRSQTHDDFQTNWQRIKNHFDTLFTTEASIDTLKQTILQLAVMGKLVPQNPNDEPASALLKKIAAEKAKLVKKDKPLPPITEEEKPFALPEGWTIARLGDVIKISSGDGLTSAQMAPVGKIPVYGGNGVNGHHNASNVGRPTLVIGRVGYYCGSIHITPDKAWVTDNAFITSFSDEMFDIQYLAILLKRTDLKENENATAQPVISGKKVYPIPVCFPPKPEQHRIVAKIDELMALCDQLKANINQSNTIQLKIADTLVEQAVA